MSVNPYTGVAARQFLCALLCHLPILLILAIPAVCPAVETGVEKAVDVPMEPAQHHFREYCLILEKNSRIVYRINTPYPLDFNIHHHPEAGPTVYPVKTLIEKSHSGKVTVEAQGDYCFMWQNPQDRPEKFTAYLKYSILND